MDHPSVLAKKEARRRERRSAIVIIAAQSFLEHGYAETSMTAISNALGGSKTTLWSYFPSKEKLFAAVLEDRISAYQAEIQELLERSDGLNAAVLTFCRAFIAKAISPEVIGLHRLVVSESGRFPEIGNIFQERASRPVQAMIAGFIDQHASRGAFRGADSSDAAQVLRSLCMGKQYELLTGANALTPAQVDTEATFLTGVFLRAFQAD